MQDHVYDISHCLTQGIIIRKLRKWIDPRAEKHLVHYRNSGPFSMLISISKHNWYPTKEEAIAAAYCKRQRAIKAAERRLAKLQAMTFDDCPDLPTTTPAGEEGV